MEKAPVTELRNPIESILDREDDAIITLFDEDDNAVEFDQIAVIYDKPRIYAILKPVKEMKGVGEDEALVFVLEESEDGEDQISLVTDEKVIKWVFDEYYKLVDESK